MPSLMPPASPLLFSLNYMPVVGRERRTGRYSRVRKIVSSLSTGPEKVSGVTGLIVAVPQALSVAVIEVYRRRDGAQDKLRCGSFSHGI